MKMCANDTQIAAVLRQEATCVDKSPCALWASRFIETVMRVLVSRVSRYPEEGDQDNKNKPNVYTHGLKPLW